MADEAVYPTSISSLTTKFNEVDDVDASHVNRLQNEVIALQTYIGTNPHGNTGRLTDRLYVCIGTDGALRKGSAFPGSPIDGQAFWKSDESTLYVYGTVNGTWAAPVTLSNLAYSYIGNSKSGNVGLAQGEINSVNLNPTIAETGYYRFFATNSSAYRTFFEAKLRKVAGMTTVTTHVNVWTNSGHSADLRMSVGTLSGTIGWKTNTDPAWSQVAIGISGLTNGTTYDVIGELRSTGSSNPAFCSHIVGILS